MKNTTSTSNGSTGKWKEKLIKYAINKVIVNETIQLFYDEKKVAKQNAGIHLAIFAEPFLSLLLDGEKTIESRFSLNKVPPFQRVEVGDIVFVKKSGAEVVAFFLVGKAEYHHAPNTMQLANLKRAYSKGIGTFSVENFWESRSDARYLSFFEVSHLTKISPLKVKKKDRTAWSVLKLGMSSEINEIWKE